MTDHRKADSAGFPWEGRTFDHHDTEYKDDDGSIPPAFRDAMGVLRQRGVRAAETDALVAVVDALRDARLLVPLVAEAGDVGTTPEGRVVDKTQELSIPTVAGPDGAPILPVFSSASAMQVWNSKARPVPASTQRVAVAALEEDAQRVVIDAGSDETELVLGAPALRAIAVGEPWRPAYRESDVTDAIRAAAAEVRSAAAVAIVPGDPQSRLHGAELMIVFVTADETATRSQLGQFTQRLANSEAVATLAASVRVSLYPMGAQGIDVEFPPGSLVARLQS